jgi:hypothetical protein
MIKPISLSVMGMGFLTGVFFHHGYGYGQVIPGGVLPIAIYCQSLDILGRLQWSLVHYGLYLTCVCFYALV